MPQRSMSDRDWGQVLADLHLAVHHHLKQHSSHSASNKLMLVA